MCKVTSVNSDTFSDAINVTSHATHFARRTSLLDLLPDRYQEKVYGGFLKRLRYFEGVATGTESSVLSSNPDGSFDVSDDGVVEGKGGKIKIEKFGIAPSWSTMNLHLGFNRSNDHDLNFTALNHYVFPSLNHDKNLAAFSGKFTRPIPCCYITSPSAKDSSWPERWPMRTVLTIQCPVRYEWFAEWQNIKNRSTCLEYVQFTDFWTDRLLNVVEKVYPGTKSKVHTKSLKVRRSELRSDWQR